MLSSIIRRYNPRNRSEIVLLRRFSHVSESIVHHILNGIKLAKSRNRFDELAKDVKKLSEYKDEVRKETNGPKESDNPSENSVGLSSSGLEFSVEANYYDRTQLHENNKDLLLYSVSNLISKRNDSHELWFFLSDYIARIADNLDFDQIYKLFDRLLMFTPRDVILNKKIDSILYTLLNRVNTIVERQYSLDSTEIINIHNSPMYGKSAPLCNSLESKPVTKYVVNYGRLWRLWYMLSADKRLDSKITEHIILTFMDLKKDEIDKFDLRAVVRTLDALFNDKNLFSKVEERLMLKFIKRFFKIYSYANWKCDSNNLYIKKNNININQIRRSFSILSQATQVFPKSLITLLTSNYCNSGFTNFLSISSLVISRFRNTCFSSAILDNFSDFACSEKGEDPYNIQKVLHYKNSKILVKTFSNIIDLIKYLDYIHIVNHLAIEKSYYTFKNNIANISIEFLKTTVKDYDLMIKQSKCVYYLLITAICDISKNINAVPLALVKHALHVTNGMCLFILHSNASLKSLQLLSHLDKISSLAIGTHMPELKDLDSLCSERVNEVIKALSLQYAYFLSLSPDTSPLGYVTLYVTLMNKYGFLSQEMCYLFLKKIDGTWQGSSSHEIGMLCDLFTRIYPLIDDENGYIQEVQDYDLSKLAKTTIKALIDFVSGKNISLKTRNLISLMLCMYTYGILPGCDSIKCTILETLSKLDSNSLIKLLPISQYFCIDEHVLDALLELGDEVEDVTPLVHLLGSSHTDDILKLLNNLKDIKIVDDCYFVELEFLKKRNRQIFCKYFRKRPLGNIPIISLAAATKLLKVYMDNNAETSIPLYSKLQLLV